MAGAGHSHVDLLRPLLEGPDSARVLPDVLRAVVRTSVSAVGARFGSLGVLDHAGSGLTEFVHDHHSGTDGSGSDGRGGTEIREVADLPDGLARLLVDAHPILIADVGPHATRYDLPASVGAASLLGVPLVGQEGVIGYLRLAERSGGGEFTDGDLERVLDLAAIATVAVQIAGSRPETGPTSTSASDQLVDHELREDVLQRIFAASLRVETASCSSDQAEVVEQLDAAMAQLDAAIGQLRPQWPPPTPASPACPVEEDLSDQLAIILGEALASSVPSSGEMTFRIRVSLHTDRLAVDVAQLDEAQLDGAGLDEAGLHGHDESERVGVGADEPHER